MASYRSTKLKITIGYTLLLAILLFSLVFVHREMEALSAADNQQNLRTDSLLVLLHEKDRNTIQMLRVLSEANDSLLSASEIEEIISEQDSVITHQRVQHRVITKRDSLLTAPKKKQKIVYDQVDMAQMSLFDTVQDNDIVQEIKELDMTNLTPMEAMNILYNLQNKIKNRW